MKHTTATTSTTLQQQQLPLHYTGATTTATTTPHDRYIYTTLQLQLQLQLLTTTGTTSTTIATATTSTTLCEYNYNGNYNYKYNDIALRYATLHPAVVGEVTTATTPTNTTTFRSISWFALPSMHHNNSSLLECPIFETSATASCGTTGAVYFLASLLHS